MIFKDESLKNNISILLLIMVSSGIFGFIYETIFYRIDLGYFVKRGSTYGPWIPIYAFGGLLIALLLYRYRKKPILVFIISFFITGILEYMTGYILYEFKRIRLWDYNIEIWNFGNIGGYVCLRSVLFFGISGLFLIYGMIPLIKKLVNRFEEKKIFIVSIILGILFLLDFLSYIIIN